MKGYSFVSHPQQTPAGEGQEVVLDSEYFDLCSKFWGLMAGVTLSLRKSRLNGIIIILYGCSVKINANHLGLFTLHYF